MPLDARLTELSPPSPSHVTQFDSDDSEDDAGGPWVPTLPSEVAPRFERLSGPQHRGYEGQSAGYGAREDEDDSEEDVPFVPTPASAPTPSRALTRANGSLNGQAAQHRSEVSSNCLPAWKQ